MKPLLLICVAASCLLNSLAYAETTIIIVRHGEKPSLGLGQLSCKGLSRSLALASVLISKYGAPKAIYAPNPAIKKIDKGVPYAYVRPLATIEPLAIRTGTPVNVEWGMENIAPLVGALLALPDGVQVVAWEHHFAEKLAANLLTELGGNPRDVPVWDDADFDSIYVVRIAGQDGNRRATFTHDNQGLNDVSAECPQ